MGDLDDTICALSSAPGRAGIAVVRISGHSTFVIVQKVFAPKEAGGGFLRPRQAALGKIHHPESGVELDQALVTCFPAPNSYTGEDVAEVSVHGSPVIVSTLLDFLCQSGARLADPGEFTMRGFLHGRMDLAQAEAVRDVIEAKTLYQVQVASRQREGELSRQLGPLKKLIIDIVVQLESAVEFVEEDLPLESREDIGSKLDHADHELNRWIRSFRRGRLIRDGFSMAIVGRPNVGKSSLFNALLAQERSIVTEIPGTTRDLISEFTSLEGIPVRLLDTAGVRAAADKVEQLGVDRSFQVMADADSLLLVVDTSEPPTEEDWELRRRLENVSGITVMNKSDVPCRWSSEEKKRYAGNWACAEVSAKTGAAIEKLRKAILLHLFGDESRERDGILVTNLRHCHCLERAQEALARAACGLRAGVSEEFALVDLHVALRVLGEITGETTVEDLLGEIFSRFCIGK
jgi:tRNA modification GTPase